MRLNQYIASASNLSRRQADAAISHGRVTINNQPAALGQTVGENDTVELDGRTLQPPQHKLYVMVNKPVGIVVSRAHQDKSLTIYDILPAKYTRLNAVGRLDKDSSGLLILTNDGNFTQRATHPSFEKGKTYDLTLNRQLLATDKLHLDGGVELEDGSSQLKVVSQADKNLTVSLHEGRNRQIRRTFEALGYRVTKLHRVAFGPYELENLPVGECREINGELL